MTCWRAKRLITFYVGGELNERRARLLRAHIANCEECAGILELYRESLAALRSTALRERLNTNWIDPREEIRYKIAKNALLRKNFKNTSNSRQRYASYLYKAVKIAAFVILPFAAGLVLSPSAAKFILSTRNNLGAKQQGVTHTPINVGASRSNEMEVANLNESPNEELPVLHIPNNNLSKDDNSHARILHEGQENVELIGADRRGVLTKGRARSVDAPSLENELIERLLQDVDPVLPRGSIVKRNGQHSLATPQRVKNTLTQPIDEQPWIGVTLWNLTDGTGSWQNFHDDLGSRLGVTDGRGAVVIAIVENSPAHKAGIKLLDVVIGLDGKQIDNLSQVADYISKKKVGDIITLKILRNRKFCNIKLKLGQAPE